MLLSVQHINKSFKKENVLNDVTLTVEANHTLSILGKSGCGKTTLLKIIAGIFLQDTGNVFLRGININKLGPHQRNIVYMSQEPLLFPHLNVFENIAFGLRLRKEQHSIVEKKVNQLIAELGLQEHRSKMPDQLSGGQKQRVNFGRSIIINPPLLLLDEPFGNLDTQTRTEMQLLYKQIAAEFSISSIFVTHDIKEALIMADSIGYMKDGILNTYENKNSFITDGSTGVQQEITFWQSL
jgi:ABC-type Fe3+/spermidine/putrescine transport system ATPase subunit